MGTDIHMIVQVRRDGRWETTAVDRPCSSCHGALERKRNDGSEFDCMWCEGSGKERDGGAFNSRNYDTFAILADVRNGRGFAGCDTGDGFIPIMPQRGLPPGVSDEDHDLGEHSFSWLTLAQLLAYPHWERKAVKRGTMSIAEFHEWVANGKGSPREWSGGVMGMGVIYVSNHDAQLLVDAGVHKLNLRGKVGGWETRIMPENIMKPRGENPDVAISFYTKVEWEVAYKDAARELHDEFIPALVRLTASAISTEDVRIVFGFDS